MGIHSEISAGKFTRADRVARARAEAVLNPWPTTEGQRILAHVRALEGSSIAPLVHAWRTAEEAFSVASSMTDEIWRKERGAPERPSKAELLELDRTNEAARIAAEAVLACQPATPRELSALADLFSHVDFCEPRDGLLALSRMAAGFVPPSAPVVPPTGGRLSDLIAKHQAVWDEAEACPLDTESQTDESNSLWKQAQAVMNEIASFEPATTAELRAKAEHVVKWARYFNGGADDEMDIAMVEPEAASVLRDVVRVLPSVPVSYIPPNRPSALWSELEEARARYAEVPENDTADLDDTAYAHVIAAEDAIYTSTCSSIEDILPKLKLVLYSLQAGQSDQDEPTLEDVIAFLEARQTSGASSHQLLAAE